MSQKATSPSGVYYREEDHLGVVKRLLIDAIDLPVAAALSALALNLAWWLWPGEDDLGGAILPLCGAIWFAYFVLLKRSRFRTFGYALTGAKIVNLSGERPSIVSLLWRLLFALLGPLNFVLDIVWMTGDANRQTLRDKFAGTYVVRRHASPAGAGPIAIRIYMFSGMSFLFKEVKRTTA